MAVMVNARSRFSRLQASANTRANVLRSCDVLKMALTPDVWRSFTTLGDGSQR